MMNDTKTDMTMTCKACNVACQRFGKHRNGLRRFRCPQCKRTYTEPHQRVLDATYIPEDRIVLALQLLLEGNSIRSTERITKLDRNTIMRILVLAGERCAALHDSRMRNITAKFVQADEMA
jgi:transposase-like protein